MTREQLMVEARAKITWGDEPGAVRVFLLSNGMSPAEADTQLQQLITERTAAIRKAAVRDAVIGGAILCLCAGFIFHGLKYPSRLFPTRQGQAMIFAGFVGLYGIWRLVRALFYLVRPQSETAPLTDVSPWK